MILEVTTRPLTIANLTLPYIAPAKSAYVRSLSLVYLVFVPVSIVALLCALLLPEYTLERSTDGHPVRQIPLHVSVLRLLTPKTDVTCGP